SRLLGPAFSAADITTRWSGVMGFSPDGLPLVGPLPEFPAGNVWFCGAFTGHGMSMGFRTAGAAVAGMVEGVKSPFEMSRCVAPGGEGRARPQGVAGVRVGCRWRGRARRRRVCREFRVGGGTRGTVRQVPCHRMREVHVAFFVSAMGEGVP